MLCINLVLPGCAVVWSSVGWLAWLPSSMCMLLPAKQVKLVSNHTRTNHWWFFELASTLSFFMPLYCCHGSGLATTIIILHLLLGCSYPHDESSILCCPASMKHWWLAGCMVVQTSSFSSSLLVLFPQDYDFLIPSLCLPLLFLFPIFPTLFCFLVLPSLGLLIVFQISSSYSYSHCST